MSSSAPGFRCAVCGRWEATAFDECPKCGAWGASLAVVAAPPRPASSRLVPLRDVRSTPVERLACAEPWHTLLGGGLPLGKTLLVYGRGGSGKTTELVRLASSIPGSCFLPFEPEQGPETLGPLAERIGVDATELLTFPGERPTLADVAAELRAFPRPLIVTDSVASFDEDPLTVLHTLREAAGARATLVLIVHVTKNGRMRGPETLSHDCSATIRMTARSIFVVKSRFCAAPTRTPRPGVSARALRTPDGPRERRGDGKAN